MSEECCRTGEGVKSPSEICIDPSWQRTSIAGYPIKAAQATPRRALLEEAANLISNDRNTSYGEPLADFTRTAELWNAYGVLIDGKPVQPNHVAELMILLKMSRQSHMPTKRDNLLDIAGYAGCGWECVELTNG